ncbi:MAG: ParB/RepB/Spo0J family partition protein [Gallionella sp.]|nr:ParB/RepB/Spo0J family partition protein [Gallionella sp.]
MSRVSDQDLAAGLRQRKKPETIAEEVRHTIVSQMHADAMRLPLDKISASPYQVRQINEQTLEDLMESIRNTGGLITPVIVRPIDQGYELVAGHTRFLAYIRLGYPDIPAVVRLMNNAEASRALAADNLTRKDLTDYEIFKLLDTLMSDGYLKSNSEAGRLLGRSRQDIIRYLAYGKLPAEIITLLEQQPALIGAAAAKSVLDYLPTHTDTVIEAFNRLSSGHIKTQVAAILWIRQQLRDKPVHLEQQVLDKSGISVGKLTRGSGGIRLAGKTFDLEKIEAAIKTVLQDQGYRF